jgi:hypothetical protein
MWSVSRHSCSVLSIYVPGITLIDLYSRADRSTCGKAEISQLEDTLGCHIDVVGLHIHVNYATCMKMVQRLGHLRSLMGADVSVRMTHGPKKHLQENGRKLL